jgi:SAM-dependent methyltransferase
MVEGPKIPLIPIGFVGVATLLFEILLTRVFSVTMWYHFAFIAISLALFGLAASGVAATFLRRFFQTKDSSHTLGWACIGFGLVIPISFLIDLHVPFLLLESTKAYLFFFFKFLVLSLPFFFSGLTISLAFMSSPLTVNKVYFADLVGGGIGCALVVPILTALPAPDGILLTATFPLIASALFFRNVSTNRESMLGVILALVAVLFVVVDQQTGWIRVVNVKSYDPNVAQEKERPKIFERWHPVSRIAVHPIPYSTTPETWWHSKPVTGGYPKVAEITNDGGARTFLYRADKNYHRALFEYDLSDIVYSLVRSPDVLVIGVGGGKDILAALAFQAHSVTGVELNPVMIDLQTIFSEFTGNAFHDPRVSVLIGEGRNYVASHDQRFDVIQISATDTWAASAMGAYALSENYLYTEEAIQDFVRSLKPNGYLTICRFFPDATRLTALVTKALAQIGIQDPGKRLLIARSRTSINVIVKNGVINSTELAQFEATVRKGGHAFIYAPQVENGLSTLPIDRLQRDIVGGKNLDQLSRIAGINLQPTTDDDPFFFNLVPVRDIFGGIQNSGGAFAFQHRRALSLLLGMLLICLVVALMFLIFPLLLKDDNKIFGEVSKSTRLRVSVYFFLLGIAYLLIEIPLMQRLILFLGHPIYSLTVVLFALLIASGIGSLISERLINSAVAKYLWIILFVVLGIVSFFLTPFLRSQIGLPTTARVIISVLIIFPVGFLMGIPFPSGLRAAGQIHPSLVPWAWALNGAGSVVAPVIAMIVAIAGGFTLAQLLGTTAYLLAFAIFGIGAISLKTEAEPVPIPARS